MVYHFFQFSTICPQHDLGGNNLNKYNKHNKKHQATGCDCVEFVIQIFIYVYVRIYIYIYNDAYIQICGYVEYAITKPT